MSNKIAIAGGSGFVGQKLQEVLTNAGYEVSLVTRSPKRETDIEWSPSESRLASDAFQGFAGIINLAGENIASGLWTQAKRKRIVDSRVQSTTLLCEHLAKMPANIRPPKLINASAIGYYGDRGDEIMTEESSPGDSFLSKTCIAWEQATDAAKQAGVQVINGRIGVVFDTEEAALAKLISVVKLGMGGNVGSGKQYWSWISRDDLASSMLFLLGTELQGPVNLVSPTPIQFRDMIKKLAKALHRPSFMHVPAFAVKMLGGEMAFELSLASTRVLPKRLSDAGFQFSHTDLDAFIKGNINPEFEIASN